MSPATVDSPTNTAAGKSVDLSSYSYVCPVGVEALSVVGLTGVGLRVGGVIGAIAGSVIGLEAGPRLAEAWCSNPDPDALKLISVPQPTNLPYLIAGQGLPKNPLGTLEKIGGDSKKLVGDLAANSYVCPIGVEAASLVGATVGIRALSGKIGFGRISLGRTRGGVLGVIAGAELGPRLAEALCDHPDPKVMEWISIVQPSKLPDRENCQEIVTIGTPAAGLILGSKVGFWGGLAGFGAGVLAAPAVTRSICKNVDDTKDDGTKDDSYWKPIKHLYEWITEPARPTQTELTAPKL